MSIILANFGKYAISDCPFILCVESLATNGWPVLEWEHKKASELAVFSLRSLWGNNAIYGITGVLRAGWSCTLSRSERPLLRCYIFMETMIKIGRALKISLILWKQAYPNTWGNRLKIHCSQLLDKKQSSLVYSVNAQYEAMALSYSLWSSHSLLVLVYFPDLVAFFSIWFVIVCLQALTEVQSNTSGKWFGKKMLIPLSWQPMFLSMQG